MALASFASLHFSCFAHAPQSIYSWCTGQFADSAFASRAILARETASPKALSTALNQASDSGFATAGKSTDDGGSPGGQATRNPPSVHSAPLGGGPETDFETLLAPVLGPAYGFALGMTHHREDAEDLVQNAAVRAFSAFDRFEKGTNFKAWFFRILTNLWLHTCRDATRKPQTQDLDDVPEWSLWAQMQRFAPRSNDPAALLLARFDSEQMGLAFAALPDEQRVVTLLHLVEDFSYQEIADLVRCPVGTVRSRLHRGRKTLQRALWQTASEQGLVSKNQNPDAQNPP